ncbi:MAG TPA: hypothetical protein VJ838_16435, partial [Gaiellaceae bacterium]|nr:hypothetical protein [Gaiellaceae bacterium]
MSFTDRNLVPRAPAGPAIPTGARTALLSWFAGHGVGATVIWETFLQREAFGSWQEIDEDVRARFGDDEADAFATAMNAHFERERHRMVAAGGVNYDAEPALKALPAPWFVNALEYALAFGGYGGVNFDGVKEINRVFQKVGASYRFGFDGQAQWHGDPGVYEQVLNPALAALADARLAGCASEFHAALRHLTAGTEKDREDAVEESGKAVESAMKVVLDSHSVARQGNETAFP